ncbi:MAG: hypothetical protein J6U58_03280 [Bacteroidaceae bacterium]|nr:hypothetical protein [Bacteroidaceae bacterium]
MEIETIPVLTFIANSLRTPTKEEGLRTAVFTDVTAAHRFKLKSQEIKLYDRNGSD